MPTPFLYMFYGQGALAAVVAAVGTWLWWHDIDTPGTRAFLESMTGAYMTLFIMACCYGAVA